MYFEFVREPREGATWTPTVDVCERTDEIVIIVEMPGVHRSDVQLAWNDGVLIISGLKRQTPPDHGVAKYLCIERTYGHFRREIYINLTDDQQHVKTKSNDGMKKINPP